MRHIKHNDNGDKIVKNSKLKKHTQLKNLILRYLIGFQYFFFTRVSPGRIFFTKIYFDERARSNVRKIIKSIYFEKSYVITKVAEQYIYDGKVVMIDIGANIGISSLYFAKKYPLMEIVCIEASPKNFVLLRKNVKSNNLKRIKTIQGFASNLSGQQIDFFHNVLSPGGSAGVGYKNFPSTPIELYSVKSIKISDLILDSKNFFVLKVDIEGAEYKVLKDLADSNVTDRIILLIVEVTMGNSREFEALSEIIRLYSKLGFTYRITSDFQNKDIVELNKQGHLLLYLMNQKY